MITWIGTGMFVFDEYKLYTTSSLLGVFGATCVCLLGVKFLTMKNSAAE